MNLEGPKSVFRVERGSPGEVVALLITALVINLHL